MTRIANRALRGRSTALAGNKTVTFDAQGIAEVSPEDAAALAAVPGFSVLEDEAPAKPEKEPVKEPETAKDAEVTGDDTEKSDPTETKKSSKGKGR